MRYSILGFNQARVLSLSAIVRSSEGDESVLRLDASDLLILNLLADFPNRIQVKKIMKDDKVFFWASYDEILEELPILGIKKQALANRFDKLETLHLVEREYIAVDAKHQNATFFSLTKVYESLLYERGGYRSEIRDGIVVEYDTNNNNITTDNIVIEEKEKNIIKRKRNDYPDDFNKAWELALRKGSKEEAYRRWCKLKPEDKEKVLSHLPFYYKSNERQYLKDFSGYLNKCYYSNVVYDRQGNLLYDPERQSEDIYRPMCGGAFMWNDYYKCYLYTGYWDGHIPDGYTDDNRPDGAQVTLNSGRGMVVWSKTERRWNKQ